jgi:hypothetical protein
VTVDPTLKTVCITSVTKTARGMALKLSGNVLQNYPQLILTCQQIINLWITLWTGYRITIGITLLMAIRAKLLNGKKKDRLLPKSQVNLPKQRHQPG